MGTDGYYRVYHPTEWLFPPRGNAAATMDTASVLHICYAAKQRAGITKVFGR